MYWWLIVDIEKFFRGGMLGDKNLFGEGWGLILNFSKFKNWVYEVWNIWGFVFFRFVLLINVNKCW